MNCRHCHTPLRLTFLDLGSAPPSNAYLDAAGLKAPETWFPLRVLVCETCWLVQTEDHAGREALFTDDYAYFSSFSASWLAHAKRYAEAVAERFGLGAGATVVEVAANDGYLLQYVQALGIPCYGIEPTAGTAAAAREKGIEIVERFFGTALGAELAAAGRQADLIAANNVLAHVPDINDFVAGFARLLKPAGVATFEFPHLLRMVEGSQFDTAYHEHYSYLSLTAVRRIFAANGLDLFDVEELPTHGGSLRLFAQRAGGPHPVVPTVAAMLERETEAGVCTAGYYRGFQAAAERIKNDLLRFLLDARAASLKVGAYGAAAKGNTLLNFAGVRPDLLPYVVDANPAKTSKIYAGQPYPDRRRGPSSRRPARSHPDLALEPSRRDRGQLADARTWGARFAVAVPQLDLS